jgi:urease accessory protein
VPPAPIEPAFVNALREQTPDDPWSGTTSFGDVLVHWVLGASAARIRAALVEVWSLLRPRLFGRPACPPRIWAT